MEGRALRAVAMAEAVTSTGREGVKYPPQATTKDPATGEIPGTRVLATTVPWLSRGEAEEEATVSTGTAPRGSRKVMDHTCPVTALPGEGCTLSTRDTLTESMSCRVMRPVAMSAADTEWRKVTGVEEGPKATVKEPEEMEVGAYVVMVCTAGWKGAVVERVMVCTSVTPLAVPRSDTRSSAVVQAMEEPAG
jgi:hypothetical protein